MAEPKTEEAQRLQRARSAYEGGDDARSRERGEVHDMSLARVFPDFDTLPADALAQWADALYAPLHAWIAECVQAEPFAEEWA
jgi:hypothetical protein